MPIIKHVWCGVLPTLLKMVDLAVDNTIHMHENLLPLSSFSGLLEVIIFFVGLFSFKLK